MYQGDVVSASPLILTPLAYNKRCLPKGPAQRQTTLFEVSNFNRGYIAALSKSLAQLRATAWKVHRTHNLNSPSARDDDVPPNTPRPTVPSSRLPPIFRRRASIDTDGPIAGHGNRSPRRDGSHHMRHQWRRDAPTEARFAFADGQVGRGRRESNRAGEWTGLLFFSFLSALPVFKMRC
jgi:hypothetical protein